MPAGRPPESPEQQRLKGVRPCRQVTHIFGEWHERPDPDELAPPEWLNARAKKIWGQKIAVYRQRGQKVDGFQAALAQYCYIEAEIIKRHEINDRIDEAILEIVTLGRPKEGILEQLNSNKQPVTSPMTRDLIKFMIEFYDTPLSQRVKAGGNTKDDKGGTFKKYAKPAA